MQSKVYKYYYTLNKCLTRILGKKLHTFTYSLIFLSILCNSDLNGQANALVDNTLTPMITGNLPNLQVNTLGFTNKDRIIDSDLTTNWAHYNLPVLLGFAWIEVEDLSANGAQEFPVGSYAGVVIGDNTILNVLGTFKVITYLDGEEQESESSSSLVGLNLVGNRSQIGFITTKRFDKIRFEFTALLGAGTVTVYNMLVKKFGNNIVPPCNAISPLSNPSYSTHINPARSTSTGVTLSAFINSNNVVSSDPNDHATITPAVVNLLATHSMSVQAQVGDFSGPNFVGFEFSNPTVLGLNLLDRITLTTYNNGSQVDQFSGNNLLLSAALLNGSQRNKVGFITSNTFDEIQITFTIPANVNLGTTEIYNAFIEHFCASSTTLPNNTIASLNNPEWPTAINHVRTNTTGVTLSNWSNTYDAVSPSTTDYATLNPGLLGVLTTSRISVKSMIGSFTGINLVGFEIENTTILGLDLLNRVTLNTYLGGNFVQTATGNNLLLSVGLIQGSGKQMITFLSTAEFDEIQLEFVTPANVNLGETKVYRPVIEKFASVPLPACNTVTSLVSTANPIYINMQRTNFEGAACVGCPFYDLDKIIDGDPATHAVLDITAVVGAIGSVSVRNALDDYPANTFAGFDIEYNELVGIDVATGVVIRMYRDGQPVYIADNPNLLAGVGTLLLNGRIRERVGVICPVPFDEVRISFTNLVNVSLGQVRLYDFIIQNNCEKELDCSTTYNLNTPQFPVVINFEKTGVEGALCVACEVDEAWKLVDNNFSNFARINSTVNTLAQSSISVKDAVNTFYPGTVVGISVKKNSFPIALSLINYVTLTTYNNGVPQQVIGGAGLLDLTAIVLNVTLGPPPGDFFNIGFEAGRPFDEVKITYGSLVSGIDTYLDVYAVFIDNSKAIFTGGVNPTYCMKTNPDFNVGLIDEEILGDVSTNDFINDGPGQYSSPIAIPGNPAPDMVDLNADGTYSFTGTMEGVYRFSINVCSQNAIPVCRREPLAITVKESFGINNPTANTDIASVEGSDSDPNTVNIKILVNDKEGNASGALDVPTLLIPPMNGVANIQGNGTANYTPNDGFYGVDSFTYSVCEIPSTPSCATAKVYVTVLPGDLVNTTAAADDYISAGPGEEVSGNVSDNDVDLEGNGQNVVPQTLSLPQANIVLSATGDYTIEPAPGFFGSIDIPYQTCDDGSPSACASATLHVLVNKSGTNLAPVISFLPNTTVGLQPVSIIANVYEFNDVPSSGMITVLITKDQAYTINFDPAATVVNGQQVNNANWTLDNSNSFAYIFTSTTVIPASGVSRIGLTTSNSIGSTNSRGNRVVGMIIQDNSGGEVNQANTDNYDDDRIIFSF